MAFDPLFRNAHTQTIAGALWPRPFDGRKYPVASTYHDTESGTRVLVHSQQPHGKPRGSLLLVHGLEGSSDGGYMRSAAHAALEAGFAVHRLNIRSCGGTESLTTTLYHAGLTTDLHFLVRRLREESTLPLYVAGFSLGGNMTLKMAGELGAEGPGTLAGVISISTPLDLHACAVALNRAPCRLYQDRFLQNMAARLRRRHAVRPDLFRVDVLTGIRSVYEFDDRVTAQFFGFGSAQNYYATQSSARFLEAIRVPTLLIQSKDDPMIPFEVYEIPVFRQNPHLRLVATEHGGHVGFLARRRPRFWVDAMICRWLAEAGNKTTPTLVL